MMHPVSHGSRADGFERKGQSWFVATELQSDLVVEVGEMSFHLHKFPLLSRSGRLNRLVFESRDTDKDNIKLADMPGGPEAFELAAKFCYGVPIDLAATNIAAIRCAAEYLDMTEDFGEGNLISKTEAFLSLVILASWKDSITVLQSCECLSTWAENLQIVVRCAESIAWKASTDDRGISWSFTGCGGGIEKCSENSALWNGLRNDQNLAPQDWWFEDTSVLSIDYFVKVISAIKAKGMRSELIGGAIVHYALKWLPGLVNQELSGIHETDDKNNAIGRCLLLAGDKDGHVAIQNKGCRLLESIVSILPPHKNAVSCSFLLHLLKLANMLHTSPMCKSELERKIGLQLEQATLSDLLIPSFSHDVETLYDIDLVLRILEHFSLQEQTVPSSPVSISTAERHVYDGFERGYVAPQNPKARVSKLIDSYLGEVATEKNLTLTKFQCLAEALPEHARTCDDGLYRAIDTYLKAHPHLTEAERKRLCRIMDCQKLSLDACMHAAQNERLPLRVVVQVLFCEQVKLRNAITGNALTQEQKVSVYDSQWQQPGINYCDISTQSLQAGCSTAHKEIKAIKLEVEKIQCGFLELQTDYVNLQQQLEKLLKGKHVLSWTSGLKKLGKNIKTQFLPRISIDGTAVPQINGLQTPHSQNNAHKLRRWRHSVS